MPPHLASQTDDFPQWYLDVIAQADLADYSDVKGCIIFKPYGYALWEAMQQDLNARIKLLGVENAYFPLFIPESMINKEKDHIEGFVPECAVVTHGGGKELTEKLYIRPTSETVIYPAFARWIQSHRDLPMKMNQWANVVRWEMRTRPFLRTLEFLWQEGHTAHATEAEAAQMVQDALDMYADFDREFLAIPVLRGRKPEHEKFPGAEYTMTTEALARDGKAIQAGTSHMLGQGFSEAYDIKFLNESGESERPWITSWGLSTRMIGTLIVVHGDEKGLRLPPKIAPIQCVIVPIYKTDEEKRSVLDACRALEEKLKTKIRVKLDDRVEKSPGFKFNQWEIKGVPLRIEMGPKDLAASSVTLVRRDTGEKSSKTLVDITAESIDELMSDIQGTLLMQAEQYLTDHTSEAASADELYHLLSERGGFVWAPWDGTLDTANAIKNATKATIRLIDTTRDVSYLQDILSKAPAKTMALYAKAY